MLRAAPVVNIGMGEEDEAREREQLGEKRESEGRGGAGLPMGGLGRLPVHGRIGPMVQGQGRLTHSPLQAVLPSLTDGRQTTAMTSCMH